MKLRFILLTYLVLMFLVTCPLGAYAQEEETTYTGTYTKWIEFGYVGHPEYIDKIYSDIEIPSDRLTLTTNNLRIESGTGLNFAYTRKSIDSGWNANYISLSNFLYTGWGFTPPAMCYVIRANYSIPTIYTYIPNEINVSTPIDGTTYNTYPDINFNYTGYQHVEVSLWDNNKTDNPDTLDLDNHVYTWFFDTAGEYTISQADIPYGYSDYRLEFCVGNDNNEYGPPVKTVNFKIVPPSKKFISCNLTNGQKYNYPQDVNVRSYQYAPYNLYINDVMVKRVLIDGSCLVQPLMGVSSSSENANDFYEYRIGINTIKCVKDDGTKVLELSVTYLREDNEHLPPDTIGDGKLIDFTTPQREDYPDGILGDVQFGFSWIIYVLTFPFIAIAKLFSILNNYMSSFLNSTKGVSNFFVQMFGFLPSEVLTVIVITITLTAFFFILKIFRG